MHILITRDVERFEEDGKKRVRTNYQVRAFQSLTLAVREMYTAHTDRRLLQFCIDHPFEDALTLEDLQAQDAPDA